MREIKFRAWDNLLGFMGEVRNIDFFDETNETDASSGNQTAASIL